MEINKGNLNINIMLKKEKKVIDGFIIRLGKQVDGKIGSLAY